MKKHLTIYLIAILLSFFFSIETVKAAGAGVISGDIYIDYLDDTSVFIIPSEGFELTALKIDGKSVTPVRTYDFLNVEQDHQIIATFTLKQDYKLQLQQNGYDWINLNLSANGTSDVVCNITVDRASICAKRGHTYKVTSEISATCTTNGYKTLLCTTCGDTKTETISATEHTFTAQTISNTYLRSSATCTLPATYYYACSKCGAKGTTYYSYGSALGHNYSSDYTIDKAATHTVAGQKSQHCTRCGAQTNITQIPATGHYNLGSLITYNGTTYATASGLCYTTATELPYTCTRTFAKDGAPVDNGSFEAGTPGGCPNGCKGETHIITQFYKITHSDCGVVEQSSPNWYERTWINYCSNCGKVTAGSYTIGLYPPNNLGSDTHIYNITRYGLNCNQ